MVWLLPDAVTTHEVSMTTYRDTLIQARALIADPARWTQHALARDAEGDSHPPTHPHSIFANWEGLQGTDSRACSWCAIGAIQHVKPSALKALKLLNAAAKTLYEANIAHVNDELGHDAVLTVYDHAIKAAAL
jgi:hypothetical protein